MHLPTTCPFKVNVINVLVAGIIAGAVPCVVAIGAIYYSTEKYCEQVQENAPRLLPWEPRGEPEGSSKR